jgi:hypothetical protein
MTVECLIKPCVEDMRLVILTALPKIFHFQILQVRRIKDISYNIKDELIKLIKSSQGFAMQADKFTDITSLSVFFGCVRYIS